MSFPHLFILLLHLSLWPCSGRHLLFMDSSNLSHHARKVDHVEPTKSSLGRDQSFKFDPANKRRIVHEIQGHATLVDRPKDIETTSEDVDGKRRKVSGLDQIQSHDTDPLHVPHESHDEEHLGFNMDYEPPRTHPPSHN